MRHCGSASAKGFTLLELTLALAVSGLLVTLLVGAWIQAARAGVLGSREASELRGEVELERLAMEMVEGAIWTSSSHLPQGALPWSQQGREITFWSRVGRGDIPGPARWRLESADNKLVMSAEDAQGIANWHRIFEGPQGLQMELAQRIVTTGGEQVAWGPVNNWDPALPFRPLGVRLRWKSIAGVDREATAWF